MLKRSHRLSRDERRDQPGRYVWPTSERSKLRALSLYIIQSIVERHGGSIEIDLASNTIIIDVAEGQQAVCAQEIEQQVSALRC
jgi:hypothetical protein